MLASKLTPSVADQFVYTPGTMMVSLQCKARAPRTVLPRGLRSVARVVAPRAATKDGRGSNVGEFCSIDVQGKQANMTLGEKEAMFLEVLPVACCERTPQA